MSRRQWRSAATPALVVTWANWPNFSTRKLDFLILALPETTESFIIFIVFSDGEIWCSKHSIVFQVTSGEFRWHINAYHIQCQAALAHLAIALACQSRGPPIAASRHVFGASVSMPSSLATLWWRHGKHGAWAAATIGIPWEGGLSILLSTIWNMFDGI
jgi:hypothetical protein